MANFGTGKWYENFLTVDGGITAWSAAAASINYIPLLGVTFNLGDQIVVRFGSDPTLATYSSSAAVSLVGATKHAPIDVPFTHNTDNARVYYRSEVTIGGVITLGPVYSSIHIGENQPTTDLATSDEHLANAIEASNTKRQSLMNLAIQNAIATRGFEGIPSKYRNLGDAAQCKFNHTNIGYPRMENGSLAPLASSPIVTTQDDADITYVELRQYLEPIMCYMSVALTDGNHDNLFQNSTNRAYVVNARTKYFGATFGSGASGTGDAGGLWWAERRGYCLDIHISVNGSTPLPSTGPDAACPSDRNQWTMNAATYAALYDTTTGIAYLGKLPGDATVAKVVRLFLHNGFGGTTKATGPSADVGYGRWSIHNAVHKTDTRAENTCEHGGEGTNPNGYTGNHATLGFHRSNVMCSNANGAIFFIFMGHDHHHQRVPLEGIWYIKLARPCDIETDLYASGFIVDAEVASSVRPTVLLDNDVNCVVKPNGGHYVCRVSSKSLILDYIRAYIKYDGMADPEDGVCTNGAIADRLEVVFPTTAVSIIRDSGNRIPEISTTPASAGSLQPTPNVGEPAGLTDMWGQRWKLYTSDTAAAANKVYLGVITSSIDGTLVIGTRRPIAAAAAQARQTALRLLYGLSREIRCKVRMTNAANTVQAVIGICGRDASWLNTVNTKGLYLKLGAATSGIALSLMWDDGTTDAALATASPGYTCPAGASATPFDAGIKVILRGARIMVFADNGAGLLTRRINFDLRTVVNGANVYNTLKASQTYWNTGMAGGANNAAATGYLTEFRDFFAQSLYR